MAGGGGPDEAGLDLEPTLRAGPERTRKPRRAAQAPPGLVDSGVVVARRYGALGLDGAVAGDGGP